MKTLQLLNMCLITALILSGCAPQQLTPPAPTQLPGGGQPVTPIQPITPAQPVIPSGSGNVLRSPAQRLSNPTVPPADLQELTQGNTAFALDFYGGVRGQAGSLFFSPYSLSLALAMLYAGANGETAAQMAKTLHFSLPAGRLHPAFNALDQRLQGQRAASAADRAPLTLSIANSLWGQKDYSFLPAFLDSLAGNYGAGLRLADFAAQAEQARQEINAWAAQETHDRIQDLIPQGSIDAATRLVLANAIYFKADWTQPFDPNLTRDGDFHALDGSLQRVKMMAWKDAQTLRYARGDNYQAVELPYEGGASMLLLVPEAGSFPAFEASLDGARLQAIQSQMQDTELKVILPKFQFTSDFQLADTLSKLGMPVAFDPGGADFSAIDGARDLYVSQVLHKAFVAVDEKGTEAAAATAVVMELTAMRQPDLVVLLVDRPFIFLIRDQASGAVLFMGRFVGK